MIFIKLIIKHLIIFYRKNILIDKNNKDLIKRPKYFKEIVCLSV